MSPSPHLPTFVALFLALAGSLPAAVIEVASSTELEEAAKVANPGDEIIIADGTWIDIHVKIEANGSATGPVLIHPKTPGGLTLTGGSHFRVGGTHVTISGITFQNILDESDWFEFRRDSKLLASHCRLTDCAFLESDDFDSGVKESRWVGIYGQQNEMDHCRIEGKKTKGTAVVVWLAEGITPQHRLHHNHWYRRERLGKNGGEALRVGDSDTSLQDAECLIEDNIFQACNGEVECISNKSCGNIYRRNLFLETQGTLTLRHGHRCLVENNVFIGNRLKHTGGIRIIGEDHVVRGNHLQDLDGEEARGAIVLQNGIPDTPLNGYSPVKNARIEDNTVVQCRECLVIGYQDRDAKDAVMVAADCTLENNTFIAAAEYPVIVETHAAPTTVWSDNVAFGKTLGIAPTPGVAFESGPPPTSPPTPSLDPWSATGPSWMPQGPAPAPAPKK